MQLKTGIILVTLCICLYENLYAQVEEDRLGAWYIYSWNHEIREGPFGIKGDIQVRNWNLAGDLQQLLLRSGFTYNLPETSIRLTQGYAFILNGTSGEGGETIRENRIFQEVLLPQKVGNRLRLQHRFRLEERWIEDQDFRTRWRYGFFMKIPLNSTEIEKSTFFLAFYDELLINGQKKIGDNREAALFGQNRLYGALGFGILDHLNLQMGYMQLMTNDWNKGQLQVSLHHTY